MRALIPAVKEVWLADDATGAGSLDQLKLWWDCIVTEGKKFGYFVNESKSWLILKREEDLIQAKETFQNSHIKITTGGQRHLGAVLGSEDFKKEYMSEKVSRWCEEVSKLAEIAKSQPHAAFAAYIHGQQHRYRYFLRTIPTIKESLKPLDDLVTNLLIPNLTGFEINEIDRDLLSLPVSAGGLGIEKLCDISDTEFRRSVAITGPLAFLISQQHTQLPDNRVCHGRARYGGQAATRFSPISAFSDLFTP